MRRVWFVAFIPVLALLTVLHNPTPTHISTERPLEGVLSASGPVVVPEATTSEDLAQIDAWTRGVHDAEWYAGVQAELDRQEAARAAAQRSVTAAQATPRSYAGVGDCTGFSIPDYVIQRESGGNPYAVNSSSGAFGCGQVMPFHWNGGGCSDLDKWSVDDQRECVRRLSSDGTNLNPWAATR